MGTVPHPFMLVLLALVSLMTVWDILSGSTNIWMISRFFRHDVYRHETPVAFWTLIVLRLGAFVALFFGLSPE